MTDYAEAAESIRAEESSATPAQPREWWLVECAVGKPTVCDSAQLADAKRVVFDSDFPSLAPHRVVHVVEQSA